MNAPQDKMQFLDKRQRFLPKFQYLQRKELSTVLEKFTGIFSLLQELQISLRISKLRE